VKPDRIILMPGLDGTGVLFSPFIEHLPDAWRHRVIDYPRDVVMSFEDHLDLLEGHIAHGERIVVLGESFSGPLAIAFARRRPDDVAALVLCATFIRNPLPALVRWAPRLARPVLMRSSLPTCVARLFLTGRGAPRELVRTVQSNARNVSPVVLAHRIRLLADLDVGDDLAELTMPILYLQARRDRLIGQRNASDICARAPQTRIQSFDAPHLLLQTRPAEAFSAIEAFLASI
jgi:pimeloyl-[acyl-carrier protein] methyl ester esterase